jgi:pyrroloquinoline quinone biosynthesis protein D
LTDPAAPVFDESTVPSFARGFKFREDKVRDQWVVLGPERAFVPDAIAVVILQLVDGQATLGAIIDTLAARFAAPREQISTDVLALAKDLSEKGVLRG